jgi:hypothetical protein
MDIKALAGKVLDLADTVNDFLPGAPLTQGAIDLARKVEDLVSSVGNEIPLERQAEAQEARGKLAAIVKGKAAATSNRLRGG